MWKPFFILIALFLFIVIFASNAVGEINLTNNPQPAAPTAALNAAPRTELLGGNPLPGLADSAAGSGASAPADGGASGCSGRYTVRSGDTLSRIAQSCGVTLAALVAANPTIGDPNMIHPGQVLQMVAPAGGAVAAAANATAVPAPTLAVRATAPPKPTQVLLGPQPTAVPAQTLPPAIHLPEITPAGALLQQMLPPVTPFVTPTGASDLQRSMNGLSNSETLGAPSGLVPGGSFTVQVRGLPPNAAVQVSLGALGFAPSVTFPGLTDPQGVYTGSVTLPKSAIPGARWQVAVQTLTAPLVRLTSAPFTVQ